MFLIKYCLFGMQGVLRMANSLLLGEYRERESILHQLDPRTKILSVFIIMLSFMMLKTFVSYVVATLFVIGVLRLSNIPLRIVLKSLKPVLFILAFTFFFHTLTTEGTIIWSYSFISVTVEGLQNGMRFVMRIGLLILLASILTLTTKPLTLAQGLERLLAPLSKLNVPIEQFSLMIVIAIRFVPTIMQELDRILLAQKARGYDISSLRWTKRIFSYIPILIPLLFTTVKRAEQLTYAIDARAYGNGKGRTAYRQLEMKRLDYIASAIALLFSLVLLLFKIGGI